MKAFGYIRVSGKGQVDGDGPDRQRDAILGFCNRHGLEFSEEFFEPAVSGTVEAMDRPQFSAMIEAIEAIRTGCIVVERLDRLARDLMVSEFLLAECQKRGIPVYAADQGDLRDLASDGSDPTRVLIRQVLGALAQWEKSALVLKLRKARDRKRALTGRCEGPKPYGSTPEEESALQMLRTWEAAGKSMSEIATQANYCSLRTRRGEPWNRHSVFQVLRRQKNVS